MNLSGDRSQLSFEVEWQESIGAHPAEIDATWATVEIRVGDDALTLAQSNISGDTRARISVSAYPLALWMAANWWKLTQHIRPIEYTEDTWQLQREVRPWQKPRGDWLWTHNFAAAGGGMPWPDASLVPTDRDFRIRWFSDAPRASARVRFIGSGAAWLERDSTLTAISGFVDSVVRRLEDKGIQYTDLQTEWAAIHTDQQDHEVADFCIVAARFGEDPYQVPPRFETALIEASDLLDTETMTELASAGDLERLRTTAQWIHDLDVTLGSSPDRG